MILDQVVVRENNVIRMDSNSVAVHFTALLASRFFACGNPAGRANSRSIQCISGQRQKMSGELARVVTNLRYIEERLGLTDVVTAEFISSNSKLSARVSLDTGFYDNGSVTVTLSSDEPTEQTFSFTSYPIVEFESVLSLISPMIPKMEFYLTHPQFFTKTIANDAIQDLRLCETILTVREKLTNYECCPEWNKAFTKPVPSTIFISVFPFRNDLYVTVYQVKETNEPLCEMKSKMSPFNFCPKSVVEIAGKRYQIIHSIVARQSQQFLAQTLRWIRASIQELEALTTLQPNAIEIEEELGEEEEYDEKEDHDDE